MKEKNNNLLRTSQKVAVFGTVSLFLSFFFFFIFWPIGLILLILAIVSIGIFYGFQSTEKTEDIKKIRERLEKENLVCAYCNKSYEGNSNFCPNCGKKITDTKTIPDVQKIIGIETQKKYFWNREIPFGKIPFGKKTKVALIIAGIVLLISGFGDDNKVVLNIAGIVLLIAGFSETKIWVKWE